MGLCPDMDECLLGCLSADHKFYSATHEVKPPVLVGLVDALCCYKCADTANVLI